MKKILFATTNKNKIKEVKAILADSGWEILSLKDVGIDMDVVEDGKTFEENATIKATAYAKASGVMTLADDSGLEVDYLDKAPGIYSARFLGEDTSYDVKNRYIIDKLADAKDEERSARFVCAICCAKPDGTSFTTRGTIEGRIGYEIAGENGFGYDPIFYLPEYGKTTAELSPEQKNAISHRGRALTQMKLKLDEIYG
jgi:XTP/dITP diphosphohydrolase